MATCEVRPVPVPEPPKTYILTLSELEAKIVKALVGIVATPGNRVPGEAVTSIYKALSHAGLADVKGGEVFTTTRIEMREFPSL